jgi:hypothetical protein
MSHTRRASSVSRIATIAATLALLPALAARAGAEPLAAKTGLFGVTPDQVVRVSVLNAADGSVMIAARAQVLDLAGRVLFDRRGAAIPAGAGTFVDFSPVASGGTSLPGTITRPGRTQVRAQIALEFMEDGRLLTLAEVAERGLRRAVRLTLEVYDAATGRTLFTLPFEAVGFDPQPDPPGA